MADRKLVLAIDFDGVLHNPLDREPGYKMGKPIAGAHAAVWALANEGHTLIVHTTRATDKKWSETPKRHVELWLEYFGFPRMQVTAVKPNADVFLDDRAVRFYNWNHALAAIECEAK